MHIDVYIERERERNATAAAPGPRVARQGLGEEGARTVRATTAAAMGPEAVRGARGGMALGRERRGGD